MITTLRTYSELIKFETFNDRFEYLKLDGIVGAQTFGYDRIFNQKFYTSKEWLWVRDKVIIRDLGRDLGVPGYEIKEIIVNEKIIKTPVYIHHMNPITMDDITKSTKFLLDPEYLITTTFKTHNAIHYGSVEQVVPELIVRTKNDSYSWRK